MSADLVSLHSSFSMDKLEVEYVIVPYPKSDLEITQELSLSDWAPLLSELKGGRVQVIIERCIFQTDRESVEQEKYTNAIKFLISQLKYCGLSENEVTILFEQNKLDTTTYSLNDIQNVANYLWLLSTFGVDLVREQTNNIIAHVAKEYHGYFGTEGVDEKYLADFIHLKSKSLVRFDNDQHVDCKGLKSHHGEDVLTIVSYYLSPSMMLSRFILEKINVPPQCARTEKSNVTTLPECEEALAEHAVVSALPLHEQYYNRLELDRNLALSRTESTVESLTLIYGTEVQKLNRLAEFSFVVQDSESQIRAMDVSDLSWIEIQHLSSKQRIELMAYCLTQVKNYHDLALIDQTFLTKWAECSVPVRLSISFLITHFLNKISQNGSQTFTHTKEIREESKIEDTRSLLKFRQSVLSLNTPSKSVRKQMNEMIIAIVSVTKPDEMKNQLTEDEQTYIMFIAIEEKDDDLAISLSGVFQLKTATENSDSDMLQYACAQGMIKLVRDLVGNKGFSVEQLTTDSCSLLHYAACSGSTDLVGWLLDKKLSPLCSSRTGETPLYFAVAAGHTNIVRYIVTQCPKAAGQATVGRNPMTPLLQAYKSNKREVALALIESTAAVGKIDALDSDGYAAIHHAAMNDDEAVIIKLLDAQATIDLQSNNDFTAIQLAAKHGSVKCFFVLWRRCAIRVGPKGSDLPILAVSGGSTVILQELVASKQFPIKANERAEVRGLQYNAIDENVAIGMFMAVLKIEDVVKSVNQCPKGFPHHLEHCLNVAVRKKKVKYIKALLTVKNIRKNEYFHKDVICGVQKVTPLLFAVYKGNLEVVMLLAEAECSLTSECCTLESGFPKALAPAQQYNALKLAKKLNHQSIVAYLKSRSTNK